MHQDVTLGRVTNPARSVLRLSLSYPLIQHGVTPMRLTNPYNAALRRVAHPKLLLDKWLWLGA